MTELATQHVDIKDGDTLTEILRRLSETNGSKPDAKAVDKPAKATDVVAVAREAKRALVELQGLLNHIELPTNRREMTPKELEDTATLVLRAKAAKDAVDAAVEGGREAVFNHFDVNYERSGGSADLDPKGHYLVKDEVYIPGADKRLTRELRELAPEITAADLHAAWKRGDLTREAYLGMTKHVDIPREIDSEKMAKYLKRRPDVLPKVAKIIKPGNVSASFYVREPKKDK